tara:strand:- start:477 stop:827 length:351 start_codon:yes stop_codon:yes gene_type:complete
MVLLVQTNAFVKAVFLLVLVARKTARLLPVESVKRTVDMYGVAQVPRREHVVTHAQILPVTLVTVEKPLRKTVDNPVNFSPQVLHADRQTVETAQHSEHVVFLVLTAHTVMVEAVF